MAVDSTIEVEEADDAVEAEMVVLRAMIHVKCWKTMTERWTLHLEAATMQ